MGRGKRRRLVWIPLAIGLVALAAPASGEVAADRLPDLSILPLSDIHVQNTGGRRLLRFTTVIANGGVGPFEVRGSRPNLAEPEMTTIQRIYDFAGGYRDTLTPARMFWAGDGHNHWHVRDLETTVLLNDTSGVQVGAIEKRGYCFFDNYELNLPGAPPNPIYTGCGVGTALNVTMGLSVGWGDEYTYYLAYQYVDVTNLPNGRYRLVSTADASNWFEETDEANNTTWSYVDLIGYPATGADVSLSMTDAPDPVEVGRNLAYTLIVRNSGPTTASGVNVSDTVPAGADFVSVSTNKGTCSGTGIVTCAIGSLASGASATISLVVRPNATGTVSNTANASSSTADPNAANNQASASTTVDAAPPGLVTAYPGATVITSGRLRTGTYARLAADDNSSYQVDSARGVVTSWSGVFNGVSNALTSLTVTYSGSNSRTCSQTLSILNQVTGEWTLLDSRSVGTTEVAITGPVGGTLADYVTGTTGAGTVTVRIRCTGTTRFFSSGDLLRIEYGI